MTENHKPIKFIKAAHTDLRKMAIRITFISGAVSTTHSTGQFFIKMQDANATMAEVRSMIKIGPQVSPGVDWDDIKRVFATFEASA